MAVSAEKKATNEFPNPFMDFIWNNDKVARDKEIAIKVAIKSKPRYNDAPCVRPGLTCSRPGLTHFRPGLTFFLWGLASNIDVSL